MICHQVESTAKAFLVAVTGALARSAGDPLVTDDGFSLEAGPAGLPGYQQSGRSILVSVSGVLIRSVGDPLIDSDGFSLVIGNDSGGSPLDAGLVFYFYTGENNTDIKLPCAIISAQSGDGDVDTGNESVELSISVKVPATPYTGAATPLVTALEISEAIYNNIMRADVADYLNLYRTDPERLTVIGYTQRSTVKGVEGEHVFHQINLTLYCAARDLSPTLPLQS